MKTNKPIEEIIINIFSSLDKNNFATLGLPDIPIWQTPLVGVAAGDDPYFQFLKEHIGEFYWLPEEVYAMRHEAVDPSKLRVVSIAFPQSEEAKKDQMKATDFPCDKWLVSRGEWEPLMQTFSSRLVETLREEGIESVSIDLLKEFHREQSKSRGIASTWSHRHTAHAAGLGTFGLADAIITEKGTAVRLSSIIINADYEVTPRSYDSPYQWCLHYQDGKKCDLCVKRCPAGALSSEGHDKMKCSEYEDKKDEEGVYPSYLNKDNYMFGCGLCQVKIPCQNKRP